MKLPIFEPFIRLYLHHAYPLSIVPNDEEHYLSWICSNYLQIYCIESSERSPYVNFLLPFGVILDNSNNPIVSIDIIEKKFICGDITQFINLIINDGYYFYTFVDEKHLPYSLKYNKTSLIHDIFIFGIDLDSKILNVESFKDGVLTTTQVSFDDFIYSWNAALEVRKPEIHNKVFLLKPKQKMVATFNKELFYELIYDYISSYNTSRRYQMIDRDNQYTYGITVYDSLLAYTNLINATNINNNVDIRPFHALYEHKKVLLSALILLKSSDKTIEYAKCLMNKVLIVRNIILKYNVTFDKQLIKKVSNMLISLKNEELVFLNSIV